MTQEQITHFDGIFNALCTSLDITESQFDTVVRSYRAVGDWLAKSDSSLAPYKPIIRPQGSFLLGTMVRPINENDDLDIDLVCELTGKHPLWDQYALKHKVGGRLKDNDTYKKMLEEEGRRCWTLRYSDDANYHMDVLPCLVANDYKVVMERAFSTSEYSTQEADKLAIRITDKESDNYKYDTCPENWMKSNPFGYAHWFIYRASLGDTRRMSLLYESVKPVPSYQKNKSVLQKAVQILKRHRDVMFDGDEDKPISIIITTLAAQAYRGEASITEALQTIIENMKYFIRDEIDPQTGKIFKKIENPVNPEENFADKWKEHPQRQTNFYNWLEAVRRDVSLIIQQRGLHVIAESMHRPFGKQVVMRAFTSMAETAKSQREVGNMKMTTGSGILGTAGSVTAKAHNFHGNN